MRHWLRSLDRRIAAVPLPSRPLGALLVVVFLAFGFFVGRETYPNDVPARYKIAVHRPAAIASVAPKATEPATPESTPTPKASKLPPEEAKEPSNEPEEAEETLEEPSSNGKGGAHGEKDKKSQGKSKKSKTLPPIKHVFMIVLDDAAYAEVFGPESKGPYLAKTLEKQGKLLERFYAIAHQQLPDAVALVSGQGPTAATAEDCPVYEKIAPASTASEGQVLGTGCVYPKSVQTLASQLSEKHLTWRAYVQDPQDEGAKCAHPEPGAADPTAALGMPAPEAGADANESAATDGGIAGTFRDPFVYFDSIVESQACAANVVGLRPLAHDLHSAARTPSFSYIVPDLCEDGRATPCAPGKPDGMEAADGFLRGVVPKILASPAYKQNGLLVITVDEAPSTGEFASSSSCCGEPKFPNLPAPAGSILSAPGGGEVGALLLSPFIKRGGISQETYNDFSMLKTIERIFSLEPLGYAAGKEVKPLTPSLFSDG